MMDSIRSGEDTGMALAFAIVLRAVAAAQLGQESEAIWHWHVALQLFPDIDRLDLEPYGAAGALLRANPARGSQQHGESSPKKDEVVLDLEKGEIKPPKKIRTPNPRFPRAKYGEGKRVEISVQFIIDKSGTPHGPRIIESRGELTMVYSALETMRSWKFAPARQAGEPISVYYMMTVNYISG
ncbi:MAG: energy transducer TonB [Deltaproteobacteria bacterium]|nr:energy transducer TonB [Deltaproteobacteria bacterium]